MKTLLVTAAVAFVATVVPAQGKKPTSKPTGDRAAIEKVVTNYVHAFFLNKPELAKDAVSDDLAKIGWYQGRWVTMSKKQLLGMAKTVNQGQWNAKTPMKIEVLGMASHIASVKLDAPWGMDFIQLCKQGKKWQIRHVVWQGHTPKPK